VPAGAWRFRVWQKVDNRLGRFSLVPSPGPVEAQKSPRDSLAGPEVFTPTPEEIAPVTPVESPAGISGIACVTLGLARQHRFSRGDLGLWVTGRPASLYWTSRPSSQIAPAS
jgi:hypothetical protein